MSFFGDVGDFLGFGGGGTGVAGAVGLTHPDNPAAHRGTPRSGTGPDYNNFLLGGSPDYLNQLQQNTGNISGAADQRNVAGNQIIEMGGQATGVKAPTTQYDPRTGQLIGSNQGAGAGQYALAGQLNALAGKPQGPSAATGLEAFANGGPGPSAAQAQLQQGTNQALSAQLAAARSGSGFGESANAMQGAQANAAGIMSNNANAAAATAANEQAQFQQNRLAALQGAGNIRQGENAQQQQAQLQALGLSGEELAAGRNADLGLSGQLMQQGQFQTGAELNQRGMNNQQQLGLYGIGNTMGNDALTQELNANQLQLQGANSQMQGTMGYEGNLNDIYATDSGEHDKTRELDQSAGQAGLGAVSGLMSAAAPALAMLSDRRGKKKIKRSSFDEQYAAIVGAP